MDIDERLINWGRCVRDYPHYGHCFSIEYRYKPKPQPPMTVKLAEWLYERGMATATDVQNAYETRQNARYAPPDREDGTRVERAWVMLPVRSYKALLELFYVKRRQPHYIAKRLKMDFDRELMMAQAAMQIELERAEKLAQSPVLTGAPISFAWSNMREINYLRGSLASA